MSMYAMRGPTQDLTGRISVHSPSLRQRDTGAQSTLQALWGSAVLQTQCEDPPPGTILQEAGPCVCPSCWGGGGGLPLKYEPFFLLKIAVFLLFLWLSFLQIAPF